MVNLIHLIPSSIAILPTSTSLHHPPARFFRILNRLPQLPFLSRNLPNFKCIVWAVNAPAVRLLECPLRLTCIAQRLLKITFLVIPDLSLWACLVPQNHCHYTSFHHSWPDTKTSLVSIVYHWKWREREMAILYLPGVKGLPAWYYIQFCLSTSSFSHFKQHWQ